MSHLPDCPAPADYWRTCICDRLRAAEQRGRDEYARSLPAFHAWNSALAAAREAVAGLHRVDRSEQYGDEISRDEALAAIDALKGGMTA